MNTISLLTIALLGLLGVVHSGEIITSPPVTNWGTWGPFSHCPNGSVVRAFQLKTEPAKGPLIDDTAGNAIRLFCGEPLDEDTMYITSSEGSYGNWGGIFVCPEGSYINGFALRVETNGVDDETATNNVRFYCNNAVDSFIEGDGLNFGIWRDSRRCAMTEALCAIQTQVEEPQGLLDDTSLNNIAAECCDVPQPTTPTPETTTTTTTTTEPTTTTTTPEPTTTMTTTTPEPTTTTTTPEPTTTTTTPEPTTTTKLPDTTVVA